MSSAEDDPIIRPEDIFPRCAIETMGGFAVMGLTGPGDMTRCTHVMPNGQRCAATTRVDEVGIHLDKDSNLPTNCLKFDLDEVPEVIARAVREQLDT